jgi:23S rRNA (uracil747-C5)-methyltransferase
MHCPHFVHGRCRSCSEIQTPYALQLAAKEAHCRALLADFPDIEWLPTVASPERAFRNKAKMVVGGSAEAPTLGLVDSTGAGIDLQDCLLYPPALQASFGPVRDFIRQARVAPYDVQTRAGELKYLLVTLAEGSGQLMLRFVLRSQEPIGRMRKHLPSLQAALPGLRVVSANLQPEHKAVLEGEQEIMLGGDERLTMVLNGLPLHLRPKSFFQTNDAVAAALYRQVRDWVDAARPEALLDLFCGVGGFALHCASPDRDTLGVEISAEAIDSAEASRREINAPRTRFEALDAAAYAASALLPPLVIVNPPRRGIGADLCDTIERSAVRWLVYSSCNAESLARDLAAMPSLRPRRARLLDMFPHTRHYEVLVLAAREALPVLARNDIRS